MNQNSSEKFNPQMQSNDSEISLLDIFIFLKRSFKLIALCCLLGIAASSIYLLIKPKQYQASAQIKMAQISTVKKNVDFLGINIEEPSLLIARLSSPASYTAEIAKACGLDSAKDAKALLPKLVKLTIPKGVADVVDLKIIGASPEESINCTQAVFDLIKTTQAQIINPYIEDAKTMLLDRNERLTKAKDLVMKADKSGSAVGAIYLSTRDEINFLLGEITALTNVVSSSENMVARLVTPIYTSDYPIAPKKFNVLLVGLFCGIFLGLLIAYGRQLVTGIKAQLGNNTLPK